MPPTTEPVAYGTASFVVAFTTFPVTSRFCACARGAAHRDSNIAAYHEPLDITPPGRAGTVGRPTLWLVSGLRDPAMAGRRPGCGAARRSEEHTSEIQSQSNLVCRLLLGKKKEREE